MSSKFLEAGTRVQGQFPFRFNVKIQEDGRGNSKA